MSGALTARESTTFAAARARAPSAGAGGALSARGRPRNPLLVKDDVGKSKPTCYDVPDDSFAYGCPHTKDAYGARELTMQWVTHQKSRRPELGLDFARLNKKALDSKCLWAKDVGFSRAEAALPPLRAGSQGRRLVGDTLPSQVDPHFAYGQPVRPSTPIVQVVQNNFGQEAEHELNSYYADHNAWVERREGVQIRRIPLTKASRGHSQGAKSHRMPSEEQALFKMSRFKRVLSKVESNIAKSTELRKFDPRLADDDDSAVGIMLAPRTNEGDE